MQDKTPVVNNVDEEVTTLLEREKSLKNGLVRWIGALVVVFLLAMEAMGYQALLPALYASRQFEWLCDDQDIMNKTGGNSEAACNAQQAKLDLMFTTAYVGLNVAAFPLAMLLHRYPARYITPLAFALKAIAYVLLAISTDGASAWMGNDNVQYLAIPAYGLIASLGLGASLPFLDLPPLLFSTAFQIGLANTSLMGSADASSFMYFAIREVYLNTGVGLRWMFLGYAGLTVCGSYFSYRILCLKSEVDPVLVPREPLLPRMLANKFIVITFWHSAFFVMKYFYMTNILAESQWLTGSHDEAYRLNTVFSVVLPVTGLLTPLVGWLLSKGMRVSILANTLLVLLILLSSTIKNQVPLAYIMLFSVAASRFMVFSIVPTLMAHPKFYGSEGSVFFSLATGVAGVASMINFGLSSYSRHEDSYYLVNISLAVCCLVATGVLYAHFIKHDIDKM